MSFIMLDKADVGSTLGGDKLIHNTQYTHESQICCSTYVCEAIMLFAKVKLEAAFNISLAFFLQIHKKD